MQTPYETTVRVRYAETDRMGVAYYATHLIWFEIGRAEMFRQMGFCYREMEEQDDTYAVVAEAHCRYLRPARYDDLLRIRTRLLEARTRTLRFGYEIVHGETGELIAVGETLHVLCDRTGRPRALPEKYRRFFPLTAPEAATGCS
jgi:acyl-CoA thioester hydrolase